MDFAKVKSCFSQTLFWKIDFKALWPRYGYAYSVGVKLKIINNHFSLLKDYEGKCPPIGKWTSTAWQGFGIPEISSFCSNESPTCESNDCHKNANCAEGTNSYKCFCKGRTDSLPRVLTTLKFQTVMKVTVRNVLKSSSRLQPSLQKLRSLQLIRLNQPFLMRNVLSKRAQNCFQLKGKAIWLVRFRRKKHHANLNARTEKKLKLRTSSKF